jgi:hypothetical protein
LLRGSCFNEDSAAKDDFSFLPGKDDFSTNDLGLGMNNFHSGSNKAEANQK